MVRGQCPSINEWIEVSRPDAYARAHRSAPRRARTSRSACSPTDRVAPAFNGCSILPYGRRTSSARPLWVSSGLVAPRLRPCHRNVSLLVHHLRSGRQPVVGASGGWTGLRTGCSAPSAEVPHRSPGAGRHHLQPSLSMTCAKIVHRSARRKGGPVPAWLQSYGWQPAATLQDSSLRRT
jgi:hypothetical protein